MTETRKIRVGRYAFNNARYDAVRGGYVLDVPVSALERKPKEKPGLATLDPVFQETVNKLPAFIRSTVTEIICDRSMRDMVVETMARHTEFTSPVAAMLAGIGMNVTAKRHFDAVLDEAWRYKRRDNRLALSYGQELIVGAGLHAAIYAAVRVKMGYPRPLVIDRYRAGGAFAVTTGPTFFLNSRNRPGPLSVPGDNQGSLNHLPGGILQPADLSGEEYQTNDALAWTIRANLLMFADVVAEAPPVQSVTPANVCLSGSTNFASERTIVATGLNNPQTYPFTSPRLLSFEQFMQRMDKPFPLRGMNRVAVIGAGDSGKTVIESLIGQGPGLRSTVSLDRPVRIEWYGAFTNQVTNRATWEKCNRSRYKGIGRALYDERSPATTTTVRLRKKVASIALGYETVLVNERSFDYVVDCRGFLTGTPVSVPSMARKEFSGLTVGRQNATGDVFLIGPAARIEPNELELEQSRQIGENATSMFLYAKRTAALAAAL